jgi:hypothetical protein
VPQGSTGGTCGPCGGGGNDGGTGGGDGGVTIPPDAGCSLFGQVCVTNNDCCYCRASTVVARRPSSDALRAHAGPSCAHAVTS